MVEYRGEPLLEYATRVFKEFHARCFWHWRADAPVTEVILPLIIHGLCTYGGRKGLQAAAKLQELQSK